MQCLRLLVLVPALVACGGDAATGGDDDASPDGPLATFCDGTPHEIGSGIVNALDIDGSGRLVAVGTQVMPSQTLFVRRLAASGELDGSFGDAGVATVPGPRTDGHAVHVRADGTIFVGGGVENGNNLMPVVLGFTDAGQPTGLQVTDPTSSASVIDRIFTRDATIIVSADGILRRITPAGEYDATFGRNGSNFVGDAVAMSDSGFVVAVTQLEQIETYRLTPDGVDIVDSGVMTDMNAHQVAAAMSRADHVTFVGDVNTDTFGTFDLAVGRVLANNAFDTASYPPNGFAVVHGTSPARAAVELADGGILAAVNASLVHVNPDGTLDRTFDIPDASITSVADWNGHFTAAGTLRGGHAIVVCY